MLDRRSAKALGVFCVGSASCLSAMPSSSVTHDVLAGEFMGEARPRDSKKLGREPDECQARSIQFPIRTPGKNWDTASHVSRVGRNVVSIVAPHQPPKAWNWSGFHSLDPQPPVEHRQTPDSAAARAPYWGIDGRLPRQVRGLCPGPRTRPRARRAPPTYGARTYGGTHGPRDPRART